MRAACLDSRLIMPTAEQWTLAGGAYRDGQDLVLPIENSAISVFLLLGGSVSNMRWTPRMVLVPTGSNNRLLCTANYYCADRVNAASPTLRIFGNARVVPTPGQWGPAEPWLLQPGINVYWINLSIKIQSGFGVVGTRVRPGPSDITVTRL